MKKTLLSALVTVVVCSALMGSFGVDVHAYFAPTETECASVYPMADIIGWRFKVVNGKTYQRKYNYTKDMWVGIWELIP